MTGPDDTPTIDGLPVPAANPDLVGHGAAEAAILDAWSSGRMPHAWLFHGLAGIGKATLAYRVARFVLAGTGGGEVGGNTAGGGGLFGAAEAPPMSLATDPNSQTARLVAGEAHPDLRVLKRGLTEKGDRLSSEISVRQVRRFEEKLHLRSNEGGWRVAIVDEAERMNRSSENALLKILEEPPSKTLIILISNSLNSMLPTTRSRCRRLRLAPLSDQDVDRLLRAARLDLGDRDAALLVKLAEGSIGRAIALHDAGGAELYRKIASILSALPALDGEAAQAVATDWARRPKEGEVDRFATAMALVTRWVDRAIRAAHGGEGLTDHQPGDLEAGRRFVAAVGTEALFRRRAEIARLIRLEPALNLDRRQVVLECLNALAFGDGLERRPLAE